MKSVAVIKFILILSILFILSACDGGTRVSVNIGDKAPNFSLPTLTGQTKSLNDFSGKPILIVFEGRPCPNCDKQRPFIKAALKTAGAGFDVITIFRPTINKPSPDYIKPHVDSEKIAEYSIVLLDQNDMLAPQFGLGNATPCSIFIDSNGIFQKKQVAPFTSQQEVESVFNSIK